MESSAITANQGKESCHVVVAENETLIKLDMVETLTEHGFEVVGEAADGGGAVELALELEPDLMVMDIRIPRLDGISAAGKIMKEVLCAIVMLAAFSNKELTERAKDAGTVTHLVKPFQAKDLILAAEVALSHRQGMLTLKDSIADLQNRLTTHEQVDRAKGLLMERMGLFEPEAFRWIQKTSMDRCLSIREVADAAVGQLGSA